MTASTPHAAESPIGPVRGTRDWLMDDWRRLSQIESTLLELFARAGYRPIRTSILEFAELHERKSGAGIVAKLDELSDGRSGRVCLRPELTAGIVRAYSEAQETLPLPWRVSMSGVVFRHETLRPGFDREFTQVGVERIGDGGPAADAELIWLADWSLRELGVSPPRIRLGHVGIVLEMLERSGLPDSIRAALLDVISEAAAEGRDVQAVETAIERLSGWLIGDNEPPPSASGADTRDHERFARLFRHLVPDVSGRRQPDEIIQRLRRKWDLGHTLRDVLARLSEQIHTLAALQGPAVEVGERLRSDFASLAPTSIAEIVETVALLDDYGLEPSRVQLDMGFGRGLGFYTQMIFELLVPDPSNSSRDIDLCGGGRYDGLARVLGGNRDDRGAGFAFGLERLADWLGHHATKPTGVEAADPASALIVAASNDDLPLAIQIARRRLQRGELTITQPGLDSIAAVEHAQGLGLGLVIHVHNGVATQIDARLASDLARTRPFSEPS